MIGHLLHEEIAWFRAKGKKAWAVKGSLESFIEQLITYYETGIDVGDDNSRQYRRLKVSRKTDKHMIEEMKKLLADFKKEGLVVFTNRITYLNWLNANSAQLANVSTKYAFRGNTSCFRSQTDSYLLCFIIDTEEVASKVLRSYVFNQVWYVEFPSDEDCKLIDTLVRN